MWLSRRPFERNTAILTSPMTKECRKVTYWLSNLRAVLFVGGGPGGGGGGAFRHQGFGVGADPGTVGFLGAGSFVVESHHSYERLQILDIHATAHHSAQGKVAVSKEPP